MGMYTINKAELIAENFLSGDFPIVTGHYAVKKNAVVHKRAVVVESEGGIEELSSSMLSEAGIYDKILGITADEPCCDEAVVYLTGEFFAEGLNLASGVSADNIKTPLRKLGIFIK